MRTSTEIKRIFEARGCSVIVRTLGHSYRAGGEIFIIAPNVDKDFNGVQFTKADFEAFDPIGYDERGRHYTVWLVTRGEYIPCTAAEFYCAPEDARIKFGTENKSESNQLFFITRAAKEKYGLNDMESAFKILGL